MREHNKSDMIRTILHKGMEGFKEQAKALDLLKSLDCLICHGTSPSLASLDEDELREVAVILLVSPYANPLPSNHPSSYINMTLEEENLAVMPRKTLEKHINNVLKARDFIVTPEIISYLKVNRGQAIYAALGDIAFRSKEDALRIIEALPEAEQSAFDGLLAEHKALRDSIMSGQKEVMRSYDQAYINAVIGHLGAAPDILLEQGKQERLETLFSMAERDSKLVIDLSGRNLSKMDLSDQNLQGYNLCGTNLSGAKLVGTQLQGADLSGANLHGADLTGADITDAKLTARSLSAVKNIETLGLSEIDLKHDQPMPENPMIDGLEPALLWDARQLTLQTLHHQLTEQHQRLESLSAIKSQKYTKAYSQLQDNIVHMDKALDSLVEANNNFMPIPGITSVKTAIEKNQKPLNVLAERVEKQEAKTQKKKNFFKKVLKVLVKIGRKFKAFIEKFQIGDKALASELYEEAASVRDSLSIQHVDREPEHALEQAQESADRRQRKHLRKVLDRADDKKIQNFRQSEQDNPIAKADNIIHIDKER